MPKIKRYNYQITLPETLIGKSIEEAQNFCLFNGFKLIFKDINDYSFYKIKCESDNGFITKAKF
jgi:hypothetical protein